MVVANLTVEQFGKAAVASGVLSADELKTAWSALAADQRPKDGSEFASVLVTQRKLSVFQAAEILAGRGARLTMDVYVIVEKIGEGGMGQVYKARHRRMERTVALKVMSAGAMKDEASVKRFQREVRAAARLEHPNIVTAYDSGEAGNVKYLVMQFVDGGDLSELVKKKGPLPVERAVDYVLQAARGLAFAHGEGVVHRDIKPANLLLDKKGLIKILDMGLARIEGGEDGLTATEQVMGTVDYMSPEQAANTKTADARSDIYSLGCTLWFLLTGKRVYDGDSMIMRLMAHRDGPLPSLVKARDDVPWALEQVFHKMIAKRAEDRFQTMNDVITALMPFGTTGESGGAMGSSIGFGSSAQNAELASFLQSVAPANKSQATQTAARTKIAAEATAQFAKSDNDTDPNSGFLPKSRGAAAGRVEHTAERHADKLRIKVVAGGIAALGLIAFFGAWSLKGTNEFVPSEHPSSPATVPAVVSPPIAHIKPPPAKAPFDAAAAKRHQESWASYLGMPVSVTNSIGARLVVVPPGEFLMGSTPQQAAVATQWCEDLKIQRGNGIWGYIKIEQPQIPVTITRPYLLGTTEVTIAEFRAFIEATKYVTEAETFGFGSSSRKTGDASVTDKQRKLSWRNPASDYLTGDIMPVTQVTWSDAVMFCNWLSAKEGLRPCYGRDPANGAWLIFPGDGYRLPTEAEWEYACRAGTTTQFWFGDDLAQLPQFANSPQRRKGRPENVGTFAANPFGLYDMHGNVCEWCQDWCDRSGYQNSIRIDPKGPASALDRVVRGGDCAADTPYCRSATRLAHVPTDRSGGQGFRIARTISALRDSAVGTSISSTSLPLATAPSTVVQPQSSVAVPSAANYALQFSPSARVDFPEPRLDRNKPFTIEAFVLYPADTANKEYAKILEIPDQAILQIHVSGDVVAGIVVPASGGKNLMAIAAPMPKGRPVHVAAVRGESDFRLYLDGKLAKSTPLDGTVPLIAPLPTAQLGLGSGAGAFDGILDEIRVSNAARYTTDFTPSARHEADADTLLLFHCDEGTGAVLKDSSGKYRDGRLFGATWVKGEG